MAEHGNHTSPAQQPAKQQQILLSLTSKLLSHPKLEDLLDFFVEEAVRLFEADACALLLPDDQQGYLEFRATAGWHSEPDVERRTVLSDEQTSAGMAMLSQAPVISCCKEERSGMPDITHAWLDDEQFEGLAILPLIVDGRSTGILALASRAPREFSEEEVRLLQIVANQAGIAIENARLREEEILLQRLQKELEVGMQIQRSLLPSASPEVPGWQFADIYRPARKVSGDLYDYFALPFNSAGLGVVIGDVAGEGIPAALFMATCRTLIRSTALSGLSPASALSEANRLIQQDSHSDLFLSAFYGILDTRLGTFTYANAGHNPPLWYRADAGDIAPLERHGMLLCVAEDLVLHEESLNMGFGDSLVLYSDGIVEAIDAAYQEFGLDRLGQAIAAHNQMSAADILSAILSAVDTFAGAMPQPDDQTLVVVKRL